MMVALAGIVHDREAAAGQQHNRAEDNQRGVFMWTTSGAAAPQAYWPLDYPDSNERTMNVTRTPPPPESACS